MTQEHLLDDAITAAYALEAITSVADVKVILEYAEKRQRGWPCNSITGMYIGALRLRFPLATSIVDKQLETKRALSETELQEIHDAIASREMRRLGQVSDRLTRETRAQQTRWIEAGLTAHRVGLFDTQTIVQEISESDAFAPFSEREN